jgi:hypothetical protein
MYSPPIRPGQSGRSFADPSTESLQASMAQVIAEVKELAACVTSLSEREVERSKIMNQLLTRTQAIEARMSELEGSVGEVTGARAKRSSGGPRSVSNEHPLLKVCCDMISPVPSVLKTPACGTHNLFSDVWSGGDREQGETY